MRYLFKLFGWIQDLNRSSVHQGSWIDLNSIPDAKWIGGRGKGKGVCRNRLIQDRKGLWTVGAYHTIQFDTALWPVSTPTGNNGS